MMSSAQASGTTRRKGQRIGRQMPVEERSSSSKANMNSPQEMLSSTAMVGMNRTI